MAQIRFIKKTYSIIDLLSILPSFIAMAMHLQAALSIVLIFRVFRIFRLVGQQGVQFFSNTISRAILVIRVMFLFTGFGVVICASIIYYLEAGEFQVTEEYPEGAYLRWNYVHTAQEVAPFKSILHACYWSIVTMTTVGFGK